MEKESVNRLMEIFTTENGKMTKEMAKASIYGMIRISILVIGNLIKEKEKVNFIFIINLLGNYYWKNGN
jgi:hypothetical protein